jgi:hypothetical protein
MHGQLDHVEASDKWPEKVRKQLLQLQEHEAYDYYFYELLEPCNIFFRFYDSKIHW